LGLSEKNMEVNKKSSPNDSTCDSVSDSASDSVSDSNNDETENQKKETQKKIYCNLLNNYLIHKSGLSRYAPEINLKNQKLNPKIIGKIVDFNNY
jgi:hypothetical protein